jgi:hypothetical protein
LNSCGTEMTGTVASLCLRWALGGDSYRRSSWNSCFRYRRCAA